MQYLCVVLPLQGLVVVSRYTAWVRTDCRGKVVGGCLTGLWRKLFLCGGVQTLGCIRWDAVQWVVSSLLWWSDCMNICSNTESHHPVQKYQDGNSIQSYSNSAATYKTHNTKLEIGLRKTWHIQNYMQDLPQIIRGTNKLV